MLKDAVASEASGMGGVYYWQKNKAIGLLNANGVQFPGSSSLADGFIRSISQDTGNVNTSKVLYS